MATYRMRQKLAADGAAPVESDAPAQSASKGDWVAYAVSQGADETDAENMTKAELQAQFG